MKHLLKILPLLIIILISCTNDPVSLNQNSSSYLLKNDTDSVSVSLKFGETVLINDKIEIKFSEVTDSRCPSDVTCIWAGNAEIELEINNAGSISVEKLNSFILPDEIYINGILITLKDVSPYPISTRNLTNEDYTIILEIKYSNEIPTKDYIQLIDEKDINLISADKLTINDISINRDNLLVNFSYSGGCSKHIIELYAFKEIQKTNPARVNIRLSHEANNDLCEAYITEEIIFDLNPLKDFLISNYNLTDKVVIAVFDAEGNSTGKTVEYVL